MFRTIICFVTLSIISACVGDETISGFTDTATVYELEQMNGADVDWTASIQFPDESRVMGQAPCNRFSARQSLPFPWIKIDQIAATRMACPDLAKEQTFLSALETITLAEVAGPNLLLTNDAGDALVFRAR